MQNPRWKDWFAQAERDLEWAEASLQSGFFAQTSFVCQQLGEKRRRICGNIDSNR